MYTEGTIVLIKREGNLSDYLPKDAILLGYIEQIDTKHTNPYYVVYNNGEYSINLNDTHFDIVSQCTTAIKG